jgi:phenylalanyl-tRNA synthetase beta chain
LNKERTLLALSDYLHLLTWYGKDIVVHDTQISDEIDHIYNFENRRHIEINIDNLVRYINKNDNELKNYIKDFIQNILPKTGAQVINKEDDNYTIIVPYHRSDMVLDVDIADEYLRNKNYDILTYNEDFKNNSFHSNISKSDTDEKIYKIRKYFMNKGFDEVILHTLVDSKKDTDATILENSLTIDRNALRSNLKNNIIQSVENNFKHLDLVSKNIIKVFEIGNVFVDKENDVEEKTHLAFALAMAKWPKGISGEESIKEIISDLDLKNVKIELVNNIVIAEVDINENDFSNLESEKVESYMSGDAMIKNLKYKKASSYPAMSRDIAFFVDDSLEKNEDDIEKIIKDFVTKNPIIENHFRFDIFKKDGKTSYAYRFVFQSYEKTLTEEETKEVMLKLGKELVTLGFEVR